MMMAHLFSNLSLPSIRRLNRGLPRFTALAALGATLGFSGVASAQAGPGIGNIDCGDAEFFKPFTFLENDFGPKGANVAVMIRGYFMTIYAPDSGLPPGEMAIYDLSDPRNPKEVDHIEGGDADAFREAHSLPIGIIKGKHYIAIQTVKGIQMWDFTNPLDAKRVGIVDLPGVNGGDYENVAWQATWLGRYLYVSGGNQGIYIIDTIDPTQPQLIDQIPISQTGGFRVGPLYALGDLMVISNMDQGGAFAVLDISDPEDPALLSQLGYLPRMYSIAIGANDRIYTAGRDGNFLTHSFAEPTKINAIKDANIGQDQLYAAVQDHYVYLGRQNNVVKVDITDEQNPMVVGEGTLGRDHPDHGQVTPLGNLIFIGNDHGTGSALFCHQYGQDSIPLDAQRIYPSDGSVGILPDTRISVLFSDFVDTDTLSNQTLMVRPVGGQPLTGIYTYSFNTVSFGPDTPFAPDTTYEIVIPTGGLTDVMGNGVAHDVVARFSTGDVVVIPPPVKDPPMTGSGGAGLGTGGNSSLGTGTGGGFSATGGSGWGAPDGMGAPNTDPKVEPGGKCTTHAPGSTDSPWTWLGLLIIGTVGLRLVRRRAGEVGG